MDTLWPIFNYDHPFSGQPTGRDEPQRDGQPVASCQWPVCGNWQLAQASGPCNWQAAHFCNVGGNKTQRQLACQPSRATWRPGHLGALQLANFGAAAPELSTWTWSVFGSGGKSEPTSAKFKLTRRPSMKRGGGGAEKILLSLAATRRCFSPQTYSKFLQAANLPS